MKFRSDGRGAKWLTFAHFQSQLPKVTSSASSMRRMEGWRGKGEGVGKQNDRQKDRFEQRRGQQEDRGDSDRWEDEEGT